MGWCFCFFCFMQHIITQDFARNQDPPPVPSTASATFQSVMPPVSSSGRVKVPSRYSPEGQGQGSHHQRPSSRVSPESAPDKPRARYVDHSTQNEVRVIFDLIIIDVSLLSRPGKSPDRGGRAMENYEPISPPHTYQGMDKQDPGGPPSQRREAESEIRYEVQQGMCHSTLTGCFSAVSAGVLPSSSALTLCCHFEGLTRGLQETSAICLPSSQSWKIHHPWWNPRSRRSSASWTPHLASMIPMLVSVWYVFQTNIKT